MVDSDLENDLFGDSESEEEKFELPPYYGTPEFEDFCLNEGIQVDKDLGFIQLQTFKPYYFNGQIVRGYAVITAFNKIKAKDIYLRVIGHEAAGEKTG